MSRKKSKILGALIASGIIALTLTSGCDSAEKPGAERVPQTSAVQTHSAEADRALAEIFDFDLTDGGYIVAGYKGDSADVVIPAEYGGAPVTAVGEGAFINCESLVSLVIPEGVTSIGDSAFYSCGSLREIVIPSTVQEIGQGAFTKCVSLRAVVIPAGVTEIKLSTFYGCTGMESVTIPDTVTSIGISAFNYCDGLGAITLPDSVEKIAYRAFWECTITVNAPHEPDYYGYTPDRHVTWVTEE